MDDFRVMLNNVTDLELVIETEPQKRVSLKCELIEILTAGKVAVSIPIYNGRRVPLEIGRRVRVFFKKEDVGVCNFNGLVVSRHLEGEMPSLHLQLVSAVDKNQRRDFYRLQLVTDVIFRLQTGVAIEKQVDNGKVIEVEIPSYRDIAVVTRDISGGGLRAMVGEHFNPGQQITVIILLEDERVEVTAEVVRCQLFDSTVMRYDCGLKFLDVDEKDRSRIISFIFEKQRNLRKKGLV